MQNLVGNNLLSENRKKNRVVLIGDFKGLGDEGLTQISNKYHNLLCQLIDVKNINTTASLNISTLFQILVFKPDIMHYITGPTLKSFFILSFFKIFLLGKVKTVISATRPFVPSKYFFLLNFFKTDLILTQAEKWETIFRGYNYKCRFLPNAIDTEKFRRSELSKTELKLKYGIPADKKILLHIGHIRKNRNLAFFIEIAKQVEILGFKIVIVSSSHFEKDEILYNDLIKAGIIVKTEYYSNINEVYSLADYYVFPVLGLEKGHYPKSLEEVGVIDMPLSILEALSIGIPIVSTEIDSIVKLFSEINLECSINFWDGSKKGFLEKLTAINKDQYPNLSIVNELGFVRFQEKIIRHYDTLVGINY